MIVSMIFSDFTGFIRYAFTPCFFVLFESAAEGYPVSTIFLISGWISFILGMRLVPLVSGSIMSMIARSNFFVFNFSSAFCPVSAVSTM